MTFTPIGLTAQTPVAENLPEVGTRHGRTALEIKPRASSEIAAWLAANPTEDLDKAAVSRASQHGVELTVRYECRFPSGPNGERLPMYQVAVNCGIQGTDAQRAAALEDLIKFKTPAPTRTIEAWLAELSVITAGRGREGIDAEMMLTAYVSRLSEFPADVVKSALLEQPWKWFPTWAELEKICKAKASPRNHMIAALMQPAPAPEPERRPPTAEERQRISELIAEQFPNVPQSWRDRASEELTKGDCMTGPEGAE